MQNQYQHRLHSSPKVLQLSEWMDGWREGGTNERTNERTNEQTTEWMNESLLPRFLSTSSNRAQMEKMAGYAFDFKYA